MRTLLAAGVVAAGLAIMLAGCSGGQDAAPTPDQPSTLQVASPIPPVTKNPRDVAAMVRRPCELLTAQQAKGFDLDLPPDQMDGLLGTLRCEWTATTRDRQTMRTVNVSMFTDNLTLEAVYSRRQSYPFFELTEVSGYPAIVRRTNADDPSCDVTIKPAERQSVSVGYRNKEFKNNPQQSCEVAKQVAAAVLMNLPPKS
ncbi:MAG: DUF3558 domain-containing protein [Pseudonocardiaceae bacterium]